jgi:hypothetical protein
VNLTLSGGGEPADWWSAVEGGMAASGVVADQRPVNAAAAEAVAGPDAGVGLFGEQGAVNRSALRLNGPEINSVAHPRDGISSERWRIPLLIVRSAQHW